MKQRKVLTLCLAGMSVSLLAVGGVSGTLVRHVVQIVPAIGALAAVWRHRAWGSDAALPVFGVWLLLMSFIWLYLLGIQTFFDGTFSATEVVLTLVIGVLAVRGVISCISSSEKPGLARARSHVGDVYRVPGRRDVGELSPLVREQVTATAQVSRNASGAFEIPSFRCRLY